MQLSIGSQVKLGKSKQAKPWKVIGLIPPLPYTDGVMQYLLSRKKRTRVVDISKIKKIKRQDV